MAFHVVGFPAWKEVGLTELWIRTAPRRLARCGAVTAFLVAGASCGLSAQTSSAPGAAVSRTPLSIRVRPENVRLNNYVRNLAGPPTILSVFGGGLLGYLRQRPALRDEVNGGLGGQIASRAGQAAVQVSVRHGLAAVMHHSTEYQPCGCRGFGPRVGHALLETFTDRHADGSRALSVPRFAGAYAGSFVRLAWERDRDPGELALTTTASFGFSALVNIARELSGVGR
jgi:hypothetical protein